MKLFQYVLRGLCLIGLLVVRPALADHMAIVYCAIDERNDIRVVAADANAGGDVSINWKRGQSCSQVLHEVMSAGYELTYTNIPSPPTFAPPQVQRTERGYIVFVLKKTAPHK